MRRSQSFHRSMKSAGKANPSHFAGRTTTSTPSTPVSTAKRASSKLQRTCVRILALSPSLAMVSQSLRDCSEKSISRRRSLRCKRGYILTARCRAGEFYVFDSEFVECAATRGSIAVENTIGSWVIIRNLDFGFCVEKGIGELLAFS